MRAQTLRSAHPLAIGIWDVAAASAIPDGGLLAVQVGEQALLLSRVGEEVHAVSGTCPHAGAPLAEGVRCGHHIVCPWHKASFDLRTGARMEPPAVDGLRRFPARIVGGRVLLTPPGDLTEPVAGPADSRCFVILGAGAAGQSAAQTLRAEGFGGRLVMISREDALPYDRTILSKYTLSGQEGGEKTPLQEASFYERHRIERRMAEVTQLDTVAGSVSFEDGSMLAYDAALVATGGVPRRPDLPGAELAGIFLLRAPADAEAILAATQSARHVVVVGGGFIGMEAAASLRERGLDVTVVLPEAVPFEKQVGRDIGAVFARLHEEKGVVLRSHQTVAAFEGEGRVRAVLLEGGERIAADLVVLGSGITPATGFIQGLDMTDDGGVAVDRFLCARDGLYAAGDLASFPIFGDGPDTRIEHWRVAQQQGRAAALNMLGRRVAFEAVPYFWTIHFLKRLDYVGHATEWDDILVDGSLEKPEFVALMVKGGRVVAALGWDRDADMARLLCLLEHRRDWAPHALLAALAKVPSVT
ncbi:FAD-dependent oxidoreductase [Acidisoma cladoniae]|uniref:FAD-dependent oxidoreductase n=1 Tax=Acidisoma cladoniae TaxID=3040935 RepID=UPI00254E8BAB|nr:FAD-dependent oxidoreductase [Acidisoma sp. PAMC 29798]